jgi:hypothetical protein
MNAVIDYLAAHGLMLAGGASALLLLSCGAVLLTRSPAHRQRLAEMGVFACVVWLVLACVPMQRWGRHEDERRPAPARQPVPSDLRFEQPARPRPTESFVMMPWDSNPVRADHDLPTQPLQSTPSLPDPPAPVNVVPASIAWPAPAARPPLDWGRAAVVVFLCGAGASLGWLGLGHATLWWMLRRSTSAPAWVCAIVREALPDAARSLEPHVLLVSHLARPASLGVWRPVILLPAALVQDAPPARVRQVVLHELGHVMRRDAVGNAIFNLALPGLWFHPLYWWLRAQTSLSREMVADDWAAAFDGKEAYVAELVRLARSRLGSAEGQLPAVTSSAGAIGIFGRGSDFFRRMRMLLQNDGRLALRCSRPWRAGAAVVVALALVLGAGFAGVRPARADDDELKGQEVQKDDDEGRAIKPREKEKVKSTKNSDELATETFEWYLDSNVKYKDQAGAHYAQLLALQKQRDDLIAHIRKLDAELAAMRNVAGADERMKELHDLRAQTLMRRAELDQKYAELRKQASALDGPQKPATPEKDWKPAAKDEKGSQLAESTPGAPRSDYRGAFGGAEGGFGRGRGGSGFGEGFGGGGGAGAVGGGGAAGGVQLDLVNLANSVADASGAVRIAEAQLKDAMERVNAGGANRAQVATAEATYAAARNRQELLRGIARLALEGAAQDLDRLQKLSKQGVVSVEELGKREALVGMLKLIVRAADGGGGGGEGGGGNAAGGSRR